MPIGIARMVEFARASSTRRSCSCSTNRPRDSTRPRWRGSAPRSRRCDRETGCAVLLVEHNAGFVMEQSDRSWSSPGQVLAEGTPSEIQANPAVREAYLGDADADEATPSTSRSPSGTRADRPHLDSERSGGGDADLPGAPLRGEQHAFDDALVAGAAAEVARQRLADLASSGDGFVGGGAPASPSRSRACRSRTGSAWRSRNACCSGWRSSPSAEALDGESPRARAPGPRA